MGPVNGLPCAASRRCLSVTTRGRGIRCRDRPDRHTGRMTRHWTPLAVVYLVLAVAGLIVTWTFNAIAIAEGNDFIGDLLSSGPAVSSITNDLLFVAVAGSMLIIVESRRIGMRFALIYIIGSALTAFAFTFPLWLAMRERRLATRRAESDGDGAASAGAV